MLEPMTLFLVIPCYNEHDMMSYTIEQTAAKFAALMNSKMISQDSRVVFVNDGSKDDTWDIIKAAHESDPQMFNGINLAHNAGHQNAVFAGLMTVRDKCDAVVTMDADLQDDINAINDMIRQYYEGSDVVCGVRSSRETDTFFKRFTAEGFYKFMQSMGVDLVYNHADFRLMSKRAIDVLSEYGETNLFLRGIVPQIGFKQSIVEYARKERIAGESKYPLKKMIGLAMDGITSFSVKPLRLIFNAGFLLTFLSVVLFTLCLFSIMDNIIIPIILLIGGLQLTALGIIGEYIGKIYAEVKRRPRYVISEYI